jgi:glycosyltransferase involved in cell wall biosynthesis
VKIAVVGTRGFPGIQGGVENHSEYLYVQLAQQDCDITVFTRRPYVTYPYSEYKGIKLIPLGCPKNKFLETIVHTFKGVMNARVLKPDILHIHAIGPSVFVPFARLLGLKVVVTSHGPDYKRRKWGVSAKIFLMFCESMGMIFAHEIIAIADNIAYDIKRKFRREATVIPNGVEIPCLSETETILGRFNLQKRKYILAVGRFVPEKGFHDLIDAFTIFQRKNNNYNDHWKLVIVGSADHEDKYSLNLAAQAKKHADIVLTGFLSGKALQEIYSHAGLFVLPSYYEGLPIVLLEAMSYGLSCIATDIPSNRNIKLDEGRFFAAGDARLLASKITEFINSNWTEEDSHKQISELCKKYSWEKIARETMKVYQRVRNKK